MAGQILSSNQYKNLQNAAKVEGNMQRASAVADQLQSEEREEDRRRHREIVDEARTDSLPKDRMERK